MLVDITEIIYALGSYGYPVKQHHRSAEKQLVYTARPEFLILYVTYLRNDARVCLGGLELISHIAERSNTYYERGLLVYGKSQSHVLHIEYIVRGFGHIVVGIQILLIETEIQHECERIPRCYGGGIGIVDLTVIPHPYAYAAHGLVVGRTVVSHPAYAEH